jgi:hypothetical protein
MTADTWFTWANQLAVPGWACLILGLIASGLADKSAWVSRFARGSLFIGGRLLPSLLALAYTLALWRWFGTAQGDFGTLREVELLFENRHMVLAGWLHFLAFDLWVGRWQVDRMNGALSGCSAHSQAWVWRCAVVPCLLATFMFGPVGLLGFLALLAMHHRRSTQAAKSAESP